MSKIVLKIYLITALIFMYAIYCYGTDKSLARDLLFSALVITIYGLYFYLGGEEFMSNSMGQIDGFPDSGIFESDPKVESHVSGWSISHFVLYMVLAYKYDRYILLFLLGVGWEIFESSLGKILIAHDIEFGTFNKFSHYSEQWFVGNYSDIIWNTLGILTGILLKYTYKVS